MREMAVFEALACHPSSVARPSMPMSDEQMPHLHSVLGKFIVKTGRKFGQRRRRAEKLCVGFLKRGECKQRTSSPPAAATAKVHKEDKRWRGESYGNNSNNEIT